MKTRREKKQLAGFIEGAVEEEQLVELLEKAFEELIKETNIKLRKKIELTGKAYDAYKGKRHKYQINFGEVSLYLDLVWQRKEDSFLIAVSMTKEEGLSELVSGIINREIFKALIPRQRTEEGRKALEEYGKIYSSVDLQQEADRKAIVLYEISKEYRKRLLSKEDGAIAYFKKSIQDCVVLPFLMFAKPYKEYLEDYLKENVAQNL